MKGQGRSTAKKQTTSLRLYSLELSVRRSVTLPDAVKLVFFVWVGKGKCVAPLHSCRASGKAGEVMIPECRDSWMNLICLKLPLYMGVMYFVIFLYCSAFAIALSIAFFTTLLSCAYTSFQAAIHWLPSLLYWLA
jgi:hypothetical protein